MTGPASLKSLSISGLCLDLHNPNYFIRDLGIINSRKYRDLIYENYDLKDFFGSFAKNFPTFCEDFLHHLRSQISPTGMLKLKNRFNAINGILYCEGLTYLDKKTIDKVQKYVNLHFQLFLGVERCLRYQDGLTSISLGDNFSSEVIEMVTRHLSSLTNSKTHLQSFERLLSGNPSNPNLSKWVFIHAPKLALKYGSTTRDALIMAQVLPKFICFEKFKEFRNDDEVMLEVVKADGRYWPMCSTRVRGNLDISKAARRQLKLSESNFWKEVRLKEKGEGIFAKIREIHTDPFETGAEKRELKDATTSTEDLGVAPGARTGLYGLLPTALY